MTQEDQRIFFGTVIGGTTATVVTDPLLGSIPLLFHAFLLVAGIVAGIKIMDWLHNASGF